MEKMLIIMLFLGTSMLCMAERIAYWDCNQENTEVQLLDRVGSAHGVIEDKTYGPPANRMKFVLSGVGEGFGNALWTDNLNDRVNLGRVPSFNFGQDDFTIIGWFNSSNSARHGRIIFHGAWNSGGLGVTILKNDGRLAFEVYAGSADNPEANKTVTSDGVVNNGAWHWFAAVAEEQALYLYLDGKLQATSGMTYDPNTTATAGDVNTYISMDYAASIDDLSVYNTALTSVVDENSQLIGGELFWAFQGIDSSGPITCEEVIAVGYALAGDVNQDCFVGLSDLALIATNWLKCNDPEDVSCEPTW